MFLNVLFLESKIVQSLFSLLLLLRSKSVDSILDVELVFEWLIAVLLLKTVCLLDLLLLVAFSSTLAAKQK